MEGMAPAESDELLAHLYAQAGPAAGCAAISTLPPQYISSGIICTKQTGEGRGSGFTLLPAATGGEPRVPVLLQVRARLAGVLGQPQVRPTGLVLLMVILTADPETS